MKNHQAIIEKFPLITRLVFGTAVLVAVASLLIGLVTVSSLKTILMDRLDSQLISAAAIAEHRQPAKRIDPGYGFIAQPGLSAGTIGVVLYRDHLIRAEIIGPVGSTITLSDAILNELNATTQDLTPRTVDLGAELGQYRLMGVSLLNGCLLVVGLPMAELNQSLFQQQMIVIAIAGTIGLLAVIVTVLLVRFYLRPLRKVTEVATEISEMNLEHGEIADFAQLVELDTNQNSEVGRLGQALKLMLDRVQNALSSRQRSENKIREFVADASHELRTPLSAIRGYAELTQRELANLSEQQQYSVSRILSESNRMTSLVEDMLLLANLDAMRPLAKEQLDFSRLVVDVVSDARASDSQHPIILELEPVELTVFADRLKLHQALANLLNNAQNHTPEGTEIRVSVTSDENSLRFVVADNGPGISEELQPILFDRFVRGDGSRSRKTGSTGLGLAITKAIVESHEGTITVTSVPGETQFTIELPMVL